METEIGIVLGLVYAVASAVFCISLSLRCGPSSGVGMHRHRPIEKHSSNGFYGLCREEKSISCAACGCVVGKEDSVACKICGREYHRHCYNYMRFCTSFRCAQGTCEPK